MINALHLLWIVPLCVCFGVIVVALYAVDRAAAEERKADADNFMEGLVCGEQPTRRKERRI